MNQLVKTMAYDLEYPITDPTLLLRACDPSEPLQPEDVRWYNFSNLRHARSVERLEKVFQSNPAHGSFHHRIVCGHRGCGKSTELLRFKDWTDKNRFHAQRVEVDVYFGHIQLDFSDFYLMAAMAAESALNELKNPLPNDSVRPIVEWFAEVTKEDLEHRNSELALEAQGQLGGSLPFGLGKLLAKFSSAIKSGASHAKTVRQEVRQFPDRLIDMTNRLLSQANRQLAEIRADQGLILIFDNLDRYHPDQINQALMQASNMLQKLGCHAVYTIPIDLEYNPRSGPLRDAYGQPVMIPMISLRNQKDLWDRSVTDSKFDEAAVSNMTDALQKRIDLQCLFENPDDARTLVRHSGGCIRDLMHLVTLTYEMTEGDKLTSEGIEEAIHLLRSDYVRELSDSDYDRLGRVAAREQIDRDSQTMKLLFHRQILEYYDAARDVWMDVHPLVVEIEKFQHAYQKHRPDITT